MIFPTRLIASPKSCIAVCIPLCITSWIALSSPAFGDGPKDNLPTQVRPIPPKGIEVDADVLTKLSERCVAIRKAWSELIEKASASPPKNKWQRMKFDANVARLKSLESEILVFPRAVEMAIEFGQFHKPAEPDNASTLLDMADERLKIAADGGGWSEVVGLSEGATQQLIVGGFESKIDGSYQPYAVVVPAGFGKGDSRARRLDLWFHGRGETLSEVNFLTKQQKDAGQYTPNDTFVLHPYGRYSNAFKFAGEIDVLESLGYVQSRLPVDPARVAVRGFSMGGAGCWQMAVHYADMFFAANPGAGFSETPQFLSFFQGEDAASTAPAYQKTLWQLYDCPPWAANLNQCPTVVYSGEIDRQKQAADVMQVALDKVGINMTHIIGPDTAHKIHPLSKVDVENRMAALARSTKPSAPEFIHFRTMTLRYHKMHWIDVQGLGEHWKIAKVDAEIDDDEVEIETENVTRLNLNFAAGEWPEHTSGPIHVLIDGDEIVGPNIGSDRSLEMSLGRVSGQWQRIDDDASLRKRPEMQGPIDDAFMDSFVFVLPSGKSNDPVVQSWVEAESNHSMLHWRKHYRGDIRRVNDTDLSDDQIANSNLVLFGDAQSNQIIAKVLKDLPVTWTDQQIKIGKTSVPSKSHVPILVYPNPLNPDRYIVINSGFTFREYDYLNNARQTPKLPDWALVDVTEGANYVNPGVIKAAGFFNEVWQPK